MPLDLNNTAPPDNNFEIIPSGTKARARVVLQPGGVDRAGQDDGGVFTASNSSDHPYLKLTYIIMGGPYDKRRIFGTMGTNPRPKEVGKRSAWDITMSSLVAHLLAANGWRSDDNGPEVRAAKANFEIAQLDGMEVPIVIGIQKGQIKDGFAPNDPNAERWPDKNVVSAVILPEQKAYAEVMNGLTDGVPVVPPAATPSFARASAPQSAPPAAVAAQAGPKPTIGGAPGQVPAWANKKG
jgi:hypothetical protein